jgi:16S rRNA (guanine966-N2)-methyltransferase
MVRAEKNSGGPTRRGGQARELRIIAGRWRGRRWRFPDLGAEASELRPTPDRVRETLFNWLQQYTVGARCLDLFAGSGALGLEAHSRGAASVRFVESDTRTARALRELLIAWEATDASVEMRPAADYLAQRGPGASGQFDVVFLDPPFAAGLIETTAEALNRGNWLADGALIYVEHARSADELGLPASWERLKTGNAGAVSYHLYRRQLLAKDSPP